ncbi:MAG: DUF2891 domain-containing protein [Marinilabiliaceae bacterium]|nr:DUF2891 domain-containing protein [Marinilabiliaceae bacterium]
MNKTILTIICSAAIILSANAQRGNIKQDEALRLSKLPLKCLQQEYPNKLGQTLLDRSELAEPHQLHPAFYGCFDWHSSVHGHWMLVKILKLFPNVENNKEIRLKLSENISAENIAVEVAYFDRKHEKSWERTYGWAWILKLTEELNTWNDPFARTLEENLQPLVDKILELYFDFLPKLNYPIRVGEHSNTAFGLSFAWDYAKTTRNDELMTLIETVALNFYWSDEGCPIDWEPNGFDFLSPCLEEADLMRRILPTEEFEEWLQTFLPQLIRADFILLPAQVSDRTDGKLVHIDGLNFSRARCLNEIAKTLPKYAFLKKIAEDHIKHSLPEIVDGSYEGEHWLATFALLALISF